METALAVAASILIIIGGGEIYKLELLLNKIELTRVHGTSSRQTPISQSIPLNWKLVNRESQLMRSLQLYFWLWDLGNELEVRKNDYLSALTCYNKVKI
jgi:dihydrofolate reductase